jgi:hypothetical protein
MADLKRLLSSVGKKNFIDFYHNYEELYLKRGNITQEDKINLAKKLLSMNPDAKTIGGQLTRISAALRIFSNGWNQAALVEVTNSNHNKITDDIKEKALDLLKK